MSGTSSERTLGGGEVQLGFFFLEEAQQTKPSTDSINQDTARTRTARPNKRPTKKGRSTTGRSFVRSDSLLLSPTLQASIFSDLDAAILQIETDQRRSERERKKAQYLREEILSKYLDPDLKSGAEERKQRAIVKWQTAELRNESTNRRLLFDEAQFTLAGKKVSSEQIKQTARERIAMVIGQDPSLEVLYGTFTSGASLAFSRGPGTIEKKFMDEIHVTQDAAPWVVALLGNCPGWCRIVDESRNENKFSRIQLATGNVMFTVPKSAEIDRCAAKEPGLNMLLQKGIGAFIRRQLRSWGQDLDDQTVNQRFALEGSVTGKLATLDLSSASDLISQQLVVDLLPAAWFILLNDARSKECRVEGVDTPVNMFSSMGNAFTFELETLIFWSLTHSIMHHAEIRGPVSVYGDDIICPSSVAPQLGRIFHYFGFLVNPRKSWWNTPFRESCGKHYYAGTDVTPFYIKEPIRSIPRLIHFLNRLHQWSSAGGLLDDGMYEVWAKYAPMVPREWRGGSNLDSIESLVSDESPDRRLVRKKKAHRIDQTGAYLHWLRAADTEPSQVKGRIWKDNVRIERTFDKGLVIDIREALICSSCEEDTAHYKSIPVKGSERYTCSPSGFIPGWTMKPSAD